ncbi:MAG: FAD-dependent oxidoreductase [Gammaproteobacteria bacterium]|nr:FAD-dependent oxidoreductase [Gammaproteobacteria bacterium]
MRVAVIGAGISGVACADHLAPRAEVTLFEAHARIGGHTDTHQLDLDGRRVAIDSGFIVFNRHNYPHFDTWLTRLGVSSWETDMSFSVRNLRSGVEYGTDSLRALFCQPVNALRPDFLGMLGDIRRFYRLAHGLSPEEATRPLDSWCRQQGLGDSFVEDHLVPMCAALWSQSAAEARTIAIGHVIRFMDNHRMLQLRDRPVWRVIEGGSSRYLQAFSERFRGRIRTATSIREVRRTAAGVDVCWQGGADRFDAVVLACHTDQALAMLSDASGPERQVLSNIRYARNHVLVHTDSRVMPRSRKAWSSWNALAGTAEELPCGVTYWMNRLQRIDTPRPVFVSLNAAAQVDQRMILAERWYDHPQFDAAGIRAQARIAGLQGAGGVCFAGAWQGSGFHEDGFVSGIRAAEAVLLAEDRRHVA